MQINANCKGSPRVISIGRGIKSLLLIEFVSAFFPSMRYFFAPKKTPLVG